MKKLTERQKLSLILILFTILFTAAVRIVDRDAVGEGGTYVGFSRLNRAAADVIGVHYWLYTLTQLLGVLALLVAGAFAVFGIWQWVTRKSLKRVDRQLLYLGGLYAVVLALYVFYEKAIVNYRPILMPGSESPEASYPSSHTMMVIVVMGSAVLMFGHYLTNRRIRRIAQAAAEVMIAVMIVGRLLSGVHWLTDTVGGVLHGAMLLAIFVSLPGVFAGRLEPDART